MKAPSVAAAASPAAAVCTPARAANIEAQQLTGRPYISHSQLSTMRQCPRKFAFQYVEKAVPRFQPASLLFGSALHCALESLFRSQLEGLDLTEADLVEQFRVAWSRALTEHPDVPVQFGKGDDQTTLAEQGERMLAAFLASPAARTAGEVIAVEETMTVTLADDLPDLQARVDLVTVEEGVLRVADWKTSRSRWSPDKASQSSDQLLLYARSAQALAEDLSCELALQFVVVTKAKRPAVQVLDIPIDSQRLAGVPETVRPIWQAVRNGNFYPVASPMNCTTCPFRAECPACAGR